MSIYVIRYGDLLKIGYSSDLAGRVKSIIRAIPGGSAKFIGHMPGDRDVEAHLHMVFADCRFSGEWFRETPELVGWCDLVLIKDDLPLDDRERVTGSRRQQALNATAETKARLREYALRRWPEMGHGQREAALADALGWRRSRVHDCYHGDRRVVLRSTEAQQLDELVAMVGLRDRTGTPGGDE